MRSSQHDKRAARDRVIKEIVAIRKQEEDTREKLTTCKALESQLREGKAHNRSDGINNQSHRSASVIL